VELVRIGELARRSGVPVATLKHYLREGLIAPTRKSGKTMSWYDPALATKIRAIKELQRRQFLPLDLIRKTIERNAEAPDDLAAADAIAKVLARHGGKRARTREEAIARGASPQELDWLAAAGLAVPSEHDHCYRGDDLALLSTLAAARRVGLGPDLLPFEILGEYLAAMRKLVAIELRMFREGVMGTAKPNEIAKLTTAATHLSERLVVLIRRKLLLPTLQRIIAEDASATATAARGARARGTPKQRKRRGPSKR
jgi:DNA-binding transcriptional MerR regulator